MGCLLPVTELDELDFRIGREVGGSEANWWKARRSYAEIAKTIGVDDETVRLRLLRLRERGIVPVWRMLVNPSLLGCMEALVGAAVTDEARKETVLQGLRHLKGVHTVMDYRGPDVEAMLYYPNESALDQLRQSVQNVCNASSSWVWKLPVKPTELKMRTMDWRILAELQQDAWRDLKDVAEVLGVSMRTVQRRLSALVNGNAVYLSRVANIQAMPGLACNFIVNYSAVAQKHEADRLILASLPNIGASYTSAARMSAFGIMCSNYHDADSATAKIGAIPGVESVRMRIRKEIVAVPGWLESMVAQRAATNVQDVRSLSRGTQAT